MPAKIDEIRADFPILNREVNGKTLVYFDNGATTQKPEQVINRIVGYYRNDNSNVHRGVHYLSQIATEEFENARAYIANFVNASSTEEIILTKGTTDSINLVASSFESFVNEGDEIMISVLEHHSNFVPWQQLCIRKNAALKVIPVDENGILDLDYFRSEISAKTKIVAIAHASNVMGTIVPVKEITQIAHNFGAAVLIDGAQAIAHLPVDVAEIDCDFYAFSAHKAYGPMGVGVLYGKKSWLEKLPPYQFGGEMINNVTIVKTVFNSLPYKFEAGTPNVAGVLGMETALKYIKTIGFDDIMSHEDSLLKYATSELDKIDGLKIIGRSNDKTGVISFVIDGLHPYDIGTILDQLGVAVRTGNHCAQPLIDDFEIHGTVRISFGIYNTLDEVKIAISALKRAVEMLK